MRVLVKRHLKLFLKNPINIIFSLLSSLVILSLYFLFIRDFTIKAVSEYGFVSKYNDLFVDKLMTSGLLVVIGATSVLAIIFIFVKDYYSGIIKDFFITPISYVKIVYSYFFAAFFISIIITLLAYIGIELFFILHYNYYPNFYEVLKSFIILIFSNVLATLIVLIVSLILKNFQSFSTFETLYGVVIGFFTGVYIPIGYYPMIIKNIFLYFPLCQTTSILRNISTKPITDKILLNYSSDIHHILYETFGIHLTFNNVALLFKSQVLMVLVSIILLNLVLILLLKKNKK